MGLGHFRRVNKILFYYIILCQRDYHKEDYREDYRVK